MRRATSTWEENGRPAQKSIFDGKEKKFCGEIGCPKIPDSIDYDHQPGCFWYGVQLVSVEMPAATEPVEAPTCGVCNNQPAMVDDIGVMTIWPGPPWDATDQQGIDCC